MQRVGVWAMQPKRTGGRTDTVLAQVAFASAPVFVHLIVRFEVAEQPWMWALALAGIVFTLPTAADGLRHWVRSRPVALGVSALLHALMVRPVPEGVSTAATAVVVWLVVWAMWGRR